MNRPYDWESDDQTDSTVSVILDRITKAFLIFVLVYVSVLFVKAILWTPNGSTDGRFHTCGYVTEEGVTEYLADYQERCK